DFGIKIGSFLKKKAYKYINDDIFRYFIQNSNLKGSKNLVDLSEENPFVVFKNIFPNKNVNKTVDPIDVLIDRSGAYLFKVSLKYESDTWRTIRLSHEHTLEDLHNAIQTAFDFDDDHLYAFYINGNSKTGREIKGCPFGGEDFFGEDEITSDKVTIGDLELYKGARIYYVFDFGDNWEFDIVVKEIDKNAPFPIDAEIVESKGKSPQQYRSWDDE
ncbi:MAG: plasmid pRiA4b ORF-3 family protein, partial [Oscillospiraceae bacterium]|nr:plasmid pRiA4b ORF-3 family protein [Oscillospiraceae bacterium]